MSRADSSGALLVGTMNPLVLIPVVLRFSVEFEQG